MREFGGIRELEQEPPIQWLIPGWLPARELTLLYGREGMFKSFIALGWSLQLAVRNLPVMYIAAEGLSGIRPRVAAWRANAMGDPTKFLKDWHYFNANVYLNEEADNWADGLKNYYTEAYAPAYPPPTPELIVVDTLDRNFSGEENSSREMGHFIDGLESLRRNLDTAVLLIHHPRKEGDRERGVTSLPAAVFASHKVDDPRARPRKGGASVKIECVKMKDGAVPDPLRIELRNITLDADEYGEVIEESLAMLKFPQAMAEEKPRAARKERSKI